MVMPMPPCSCTASWPTIRQERLTCTFTAESAAARSVAVLGLDHHRRIGRHRAGLLQRYQHVDGAVLQHLEVADRRAELLACLEVLDGEPVQRIHDADGFGSQRRDGEFGDAFEDRQTAVERADEVSLADIHARQRDVGRATAILRRIAVDLHAFGTGWHQEQADALLVASAARGAGADDEMLGAVAVDDDAARAAKSIASADLPVAVAPAMTTKGGLSPGGGMLIATLIRPGLSQADVAAASDAVRDAGGEVGATDWLDVGEACDLMLSSLTQPGARAALEAALPAADVIVQPGDGVRRKRLLIADMDSTMITVECIDELADYIGVKAEVAAITERAMRGELDFEASLTARVALLKGLPVADIDRCRHERVRLTPGAQTLVRTMKAHGAYTLLVSGGFTAFARPIAAEIGFDECHANVLECEGDRLTGTVARPIVGAETKRAELLRVTTARGIALAETLATGDGANDIPMLQTAGLGVAFHAKPKTCGGGDGGGAPRRPDRAALGAGVSAGRVGGIKGQLLRRRLLEFNSERAEVTI